MAGFNIVLTQDSITAYLKEVFPNTTIYEDGLPDDVQTVLASPQQALKPYIVLAYSNLNPVGTSAGRSMGGPRWDDYFTTVDIDTIAPTGRMSRLLMQAVLDTLTGWAPTDSTEMTIYEKVRNYVYEENGTLPTTFQSSVRMRHGANTTGVSSPIPH